LEDLVGEARNPREIGVVLSLIATPFRDVAPWIYEIGIEASRQYLFHASSPKRKGAVQALAESLRDLQSHPILEDIFIRDSRIRMFVDISEYAIQRIIAEY